MGISDELTVHPVHRPLASVAEETRSSCLGGLVEGSSLLSQIDVVSTPVAPAAGGAMGVLGGEDGGGPLQETLEKLLSKKSLGMSFLRGVIQ